MEESSRQPGLATTGPSSLLGTFGAAWGLVGVVVLLGSAILRLTPVAAAAIGDGLSRLQLVLLVAWVIFMAWSEGYRGFQRAFSPRVVVRAMHLARHPQPLHVLLAPLFCMSLFHASRRRLIASWVLLFAILVLVLAVKKLQQPWRGIVDAGVVVGLGWGLVSLLVFLLRALSGRPPRVPADLPY